MRTWTWITAWLLFSGSGFAAEGPGAADSTASKAVVRAGVARVDITPPLSMKVALGGYGARLSKPAVGVHDAVWAKALVLERGGRRFALVTADLLGFPPGFKAEVMRRLAVDGWNPDQVLMLASHSHTSYDLMALHPGNTFGIPQVGLFHREAFEFVADHLARAIREASHGGVPIRVGSSALTVVDSNRNRRTGDGAHDTELAVTRVDSDSGKPLAVLVNWTAHPTFMTEEDMWFSGDWPGHLQRTVEALVGGDVVAMFYNGAEGDQSPVPPREVTSRWERAERYGREMGVRAWRLWGGTEVRSGPEIAWHTEAITLPPRRPHPDFMKTGGAEYGLNEAMMQGFVEHLIPEGTHSTSLRLGDWVVVGVPGELAASLGLELKSRVRSALGLRSVTVGGLADEWVGYMLPASEHARGGYEASMSFHGDALGASVVEAASRGAAKLAR